MKVTVKVMGDDENMKMRTRILKFDTKESAFRWFRLLKFEVTREGKDAGEYILSVNGLRGNLTLEKRDNCPLT